MVLFAVSSFTCSLPHFIYGRHLINANELTGIVKDPNICKAKSTPFLELSNITRIDNFTKDNPEDCYEEVITSGYRLAPSVTNIVLAIFFISLLGVGMGQTAVYTLGIPYIDDNVASKDVESNFIVFCLRSLQKIVNFPNWG
ncbi:unnamed protein product [Diabrotica balteata]|uniref:Uncharacterized protein n=1 Tax=Diabrotica balteata TaxID=107213 RepID=A0A9N9X8A9_DIABA|nr:unnamed protein product [Diabrotica balteata]